MTRLTSEAFERDRELYNPQIHWLLNMAPSELGEKGTLGGTISALEHGGAASGVPNTDPYSNYQMGWCVGDSPADKWRKTVPIWFRVGLTSQSVLLAHYMPRNDLPETQRVAVDGALGKLANAALWVTDPEALAKLVEACVDKGKGGRRGIIEAASKRADAAVRVAHREWAAVAELQPEGSPENRADIARPDPAKLTLWASEYERGLDLSRRVAELTAARVGGQAAAVIEAACRRLSRPRSPAALAVQRALRWLSARPKRGAQRKAAA